MKKTTGCGSKNTVLAIDVGSSSVKAGLVDRDGRCVARASRRYAYAVPAPHHVELDFEVVWEQLSEAVSALPGRKASVSAIGLSVVCPGLVALDRSGVPLRPAIIHLDRRSVKEAREATRLIGEKRFLATAGNLPYPGGISLGSMLWIKGHEPDIYRRAWKLGHTNTFVAHRLTGRWGIDPTNASFSGLYDTMKAGGWDLAIARALGIDSDKLPPILQSYGRIGTLKREVARQIGLVPGTPVVMGAGDTACAALGAGVTSEGDILNSTGTVEVMVLSTAKVKSSAGLLVRTHAIPGKWLIMNIIAAGGAAIEWARRQFYADMTGKEFYDEHLPAALCSTACKVRFRPFLSGDRTSFTQKTGSFSGLGLDTSRDDLLRAVCYGIVAEMKKRFRFYRTMWEPTGRICYTGGGAESLLQLKKRAFPAFTWERVPDAALLGAAKLAWMGLGSYS